MSLELTAHAKPQQLDEQAMAAQDAYLVSCIRTVEIMIMEMQSIFDRHPEVVEVSFDQDGDPDNLPVFSCLDSEGDDLGDELEDVEALAERWNETRHPAAVDFLSTLEGDSLRRESLAEDRIKMCRKIGDCLPSTPEKRQAWLTSFQSHLTAMDLDSSIPLPAGKKSGPRM